MKLIILVFVAFAGALGLAAATRNTNGYVRIHIDPYTIDANIWAFILGAILLFIIGYILFRILGWIFGAKRKLGKWKQKNDELSAGKMMQKGYIELIEGKWETAEKHLLTKVDKSPAPVMNYLAAAHAAQQSGDAGRRDSYLQKAHEKDPSSKVAVDLTQARMQYESGDLEQARNTLIRLSHVVPKSEQVHRMLLAVNREREDWNGVLDQLPKLKRVKNFGADEASACEHEACNHILGAAQADGIQGIEKAWKSLSRKQRQEPELVNQYARELLAAGELEKCESLVRATLRKTWNSDLAYTYGLINHSAERQLRLAEGWLSHHQQDPNLLLTLGRLAYASKAWDKARNYYQQAITAGASQEANRELGQLLEDLGETDKALEYYRTGLEKALPSLVTASDDEVIDVEPEEQEAEPENSVEQTPEEDEQAQAAKA